MSLIDFSIPEVAKGGQIAEYFDQRGYACIEKANVSEEKATELAIEINAEEVVSSIDDDGEREVWKVSDIMPTYSLISLEIIIDSFWVHRHSMVK